MMPASMGQSGSGKCAGPIVYMQSYMAEVSPVLRQFSEMLQLIDARRRAPGEVSFRPYRPGYYLGHNLAAQDHVGEIDFTRAEDEMRQLAMQQGADFDHLVKAASQHFQDVGKMPVKINLSDADINTIVEDDDRAINS
jgi:hypothetical protein